MHLLIPRRQLENPGHYEDLENYYHSYKNCVLRNNYIPSPTLEKAPGLEEIPVLRVKIALFYFSLFEIQSYLKVPTDYLKVTFKITCPCLVNTVLHSTAASCFTSNKLELEGSLLQLY